MARERKNSRPLTAGSVLDGAICGMPLAERLKEGEIWTVWESVVGEQVARRAQPISVRGSILTVRVASPAWTQQLNFLKKMVLSKLNEQLGKEVIKDMYFQAGTIDGPFPGPQQAAPASRSLSNEELVDIEKIASSLSDPALREAFVNLLKTSRSFTAPE